MKINQELQWNNKDSSVKYLGLHIDEKYIKTKNKNQRYTRLKILCPLLTHSSTEEIISTSMNGNNETDNHIIMPSMGNCLSNKN